MGNTIGVFIGSSSSFNVLRLVSDVGKSLTQNFTTDLITTSGAALEFGGERFDEIIGTANSNSIRGEIGALRSYLNSHDPDALFQVTSPPIHGTLVGVLAKRHDIPFVYRYSGDRFYEYRVSKGLDIPIHFSLNNILGRVPLSLARRHVVLGPTGSRRLQARGVDPRDITIIPPIVDQEEFNASGSTADLDTDRHVGLFVGRLSRRKGKKILERCIPEILDRRSDIEFVLVGQQQEFLKMATEYEDHITLVGPVPPENIPEYYRAASFLVHPSLTEGLPRVVIESLACGTPVIARSVGEIDFATKNTFQTDAEFIGKVCDFESLQLDSVDKFLFSNISKKYENLFKKIV